MDSKGFFTFSSGCAINLDDIGDFPDYYDIAQKLQKGFESQQIDLELAEKFLDAELQDIQHIPNFLQIIKQFIRLQNKMTPKISKLFHILGLRFIMNFFTSFSVQQEQVKQILGYLEGKLGNPQHQSIILDFFLGIISLASYAENHALIVKMFSKIMDEKQMYREQSDSKKYIKIVDKFLRYRQFRQNFQQLFTGKDKKKLNEEFPIIGFKMSLWEENKENSRNALEQMEKNVSKVDNNFLRGYIDQWREKL